MIDFGPIMAGICADPAKEAVWLEMLAQLEYAGCRKIVKGVPFEKVTVSVMQHVMEESSHAFLIASLVLSLRGAEPSLREIALPSARNDLTAAAWSYFQGLDQAVTNLRDGHFPYPAVSWAVEQRVLQVYPAHIQATD